LVGFLIVLQVGLLWMIHTILEFRKHSNHPFNDKNIG
jgi:hypothetical protein